GELAAAEVGLVGDFDQRLAHAESIPSAQRLLAEVQIHEQVVAGQAPILTISDRLRDADIHQRNLGAPNWVARAPAVADETERTVTQRVSRTQAFVHGAADHDLLDDASARAVRRLVVRALNGGPWA